MARKFSLSETTANAVGSEFEMWEIDTISVKGKTETTRVFELMSAAGQLSEEKRDVCGNATIKLDGVDIAQHWDLAEATFRECSQLRPNDGPSRVFLQRIQALRRDPPSNDWNGVWQFTEK